MPRRTVRLGVMARHAGGPNGPFGKTNRFLTTLSDLGADLGIQIIAFDPDAVEWDSDEIEAYLCSGPDPRKWKKDEVSLPDAVYNWVKGKRNAKACAILSRKGVPFINHFFLNKWAAYRLLLGDEQTRRYLPHTQLFHDWNDVREVADRYGWAYLKPAHGSLGRGIIRIMRQRDGQYLCQHVPRKGRAIMSQLLRLRGLKEWLAKGMNEEELYLVQQGLSLAVFQNRTTDIRVLMQKDGEGRWRITGMGARVGAPAAFTSNLATGGRGIPVRRLLIHLFPNDPERCLQVEDEIRRLAFRICHVVEQATAPLGELGLDLGLDAFGRLWYIEHNYLPGRTIFRHLEDLETYRQAHRRPLEYAAYLVRQREAEAARQEETRAEPDRQAPVPDTYVVPARTPVQPPAPQPLAVRTEGPRPLQARPQQPQPRQTSYSSTQTARRFRVAGSAARWWGP